jgi:hypothetical protein
MTRSAYAFMLCILLPLAFGCEVNRAATGNTPSASRVATIDTVVITGPYSIDADGHVTQAAVARPDGDLLTTRVGRELTLEAVDPWIRSTTSATGGSIGRVRSITGPYRLEPDDPESPRLYDVTLEVWVSRTDS